MNDSYKKPTLMEMYHHGIQGQRWGVRRYQNEDGSLTPAGKERYLNGDDRFEKTVSNMLSVGVPDKTIKRTVKKAKAVSDRIDKRIERSEKDTERLMKMRDKRRSKIEKRYDKKMDKTVKQINKAAKNPSEKNNKILNKRIDKLNSLANKKSKRLYKFDTTSKIVKDGYDRYTKVIKNYKNARLKSFENETYKKNPEYKKAVANYVIQTTHDAFYGTRNTKSHYVSRAAMDYYDNRSEERRS